MRVSSQKGGVGKTVISINLAIAIHELSRKVLLVDSDLVNPSASIQLKLDEVSVGMTNVLLGTSNIDKAIVKYFPVGMDVLPGVFPGKDGPPQSLTKEQVDRFGAPLSKSAYNFIIVDTAPGILENKILSYYNEALLVTTPDMPSIASLMELSKLYKAHGIKTNFVVNRVTNEKNEIPVKEIEKVMKQKALAILPEDPKVGQSVSKQLPLYLNDEEAPFVRAIIELAKHYAKHFI